MGVREHASFNRFCEPPPPPPKKKHERARLDLSSKLASEPSRFMYTLHWHFAIAFAYPAHSRPCGRVACRRRIGLDGIRSAVRFPSRTKRWMRPRSVRGRRCGNTKSSGHISRRRNYVDMHRPVRSISRSRFRTSSKQCGIKLPVLRNPRSSARLSVRLLDFLPSHRFRFFKLPHFISPHLSPSVWSIIVLRIIKAGKSRSSPVLSDSPRLLTSSSSSSFATSLHHLCLHPPTSSIQSS